MTISQRKKATKTGLFYPVAHKYVFSPRFFKNIEEKPFFLFLTFSHQEIKSAKSFSIKTKEIPPDLLEICTSIAPNLEQDPSLFLPPGQNQFRGRKEPVFPLQP